MTAHIYSEQNSHRPASATFSHFVEVCGLLTVHARKKKREGTTFEDALCKALGWYFPLLAKFRVASVEELIYRKFPYACPYCRQCPHVDGICKTVKGTSPTVNHEDLRQKYRNNGDVRPSGLNDWQLMFDRIYPRNLDDSSRSVVGLFEELGELAEAVRVFDRFPKYFAGEAADVFSYLMGLANEYSLQRQRDDQPPFDFESEYVKRFPGLCVQCGYPICVCPIVPSATVGRMAKELDIKDLESVFVSSFEVFRDESSEISRRVLDSVGGYVGLASKFPFDRGEANQELVVFCLKWASQVENPEIADRLRSAAIKIADAATYAGSPRHPQVLNELLKPLTEIIRKDEGAIQGLSAIGQTGMPHSVKQIVINELTLGDKYVATNTFAPEIAPPTLGLEFALVWQSLQSKVDLNEVASQLEQIKKQIETMPQSNEIAKATTIISEAETDARNGMGGKVLEKLSVVGNVVKDVGIKIGTNVVVELIEKATGMKV
jgi:NTP pyrophosphatase (non-canonical NTP hydrolase)